MQEELELIRGSVIAVVYQNPENGYTVLRLRCEDGQQITVVGTIPMTAVGERLMVTGRWNNHTAYGRQLEAEYLERLMPETKLEIVSYLSSRAIKGIGARFAARIVELFGERSLDVIENEPELLVQIPGISEKKAREIHDSFVKQVGVRRLIEYMTGHHLPAELAVRVYRVYGELSLEALQDDPYFLTDAYFGAEFSLVDAFALSTGVSGDDERRVEAGVQFELTHNLKNGHTFLPLDKLVAATAQLLSLPHDLIEAGAERLQEQGRMVLDTVAGLQAAYLPEYPEAEQYLTQRLLSMAAVKPQELKKPDALIREVELAQGISYAELQRQAILSAARERVLILTGGPGTGKTTTLAGILTLFDQLDIKTLLTAPTGRAAKRLSELTGRDAATIHRLLEVDISPETGKMGFVHDESDPLHCDAVIVDETSMVDLLLMHALVRALPETCKLILVGDPDQLPSVGAGNVFSDLIRSERLVTVRLTEVFRQARQSLIVMNAHAVNHGQMPELRVKDRDFFFLRRPSAESVSQTVTDLCARRLPNNMGIPSSDIQVLSPTRKGEAGTGHLNLLLQDALNPPQSGKREKKYGSFTFREGDRVMQIRNNYDIVWKRLGAAGMGTGIFNGDIGEIRSIDLEQELVTIVFDDREAEYPYEMLSELEPAYAMTVHKSQGSEYRAVVLCAWRGTPLLHTRSILYTAITRARELLIVVGDEEVLRTMVENDRQQKRYSGLRWRLRRGGA